MKRRLILASLAAALLLLSVLPYSGAQTEYRKPAFLEEYASHPSLADLQGAWLDDNGTHLLVTMQFGSTPPPLQANSPTTAISYARYVAICLDLDNNISSGYYASPTILVRTPQTLQAGILLTEADASPTLMGVDAILYVELDHYHATNWTSATTMADIYNPDGTWAAGVAVDSAPLSEAAMAVNLTDLAWQYQQATGIPVTIRSFKATLCEVFNDELFVDSLANPTFNNVTVNFSAIIVDGNPADWDPATTLLTVDDPDTIDFSPINDANFTALYVATDNSSLFIRIDLEAPATQYSIPADNLAERLRYLRLGVDSDNDGTVNTNLDMRPGGIYINGTFYSAGGPVYNVTWYGTSTVEFAVNLSYIALAGFTAGSPLSLTIYELGLGIYEDYMWDYQAYYTPYMTYRLGEGGATGSGILVYPWLSGLFTVRFDDMEMVIDIPLTTDLYLGNFTDDPMGTDGRGFNGYVPVSDFYYFTLTDPGAVAWPINITITYSDALLEALGLNESRLKAFYYDKNARAYLELPSYTVNTASNTVTITLTQDVYMAGDPVVVLSAPPLVVGGELVQPSKPSPLVLVAAALLAAAVAAVGYSYKRRQR